MVAIWNFYCRKETQTLQNPFFNNRDINQMASLPPSSLVAGALILDAVLGREKKHDSKKMK